jgi:nitrile hydratase
VSYHSHADLGGQTGHGPVHPEAHDSPMHAAWEARALALTLAMGATGAWNIDMSRAARETLGDYANSSYFRIWIGALEKLLVDAGLVQPDEIAVGHSRHATAGVARVLRAGEVATVLSRGSPTERTASRPARFAPGEAGYGAVMNAISAAVGDDVFRRAPVTSDSILMSLANGRRMHAPLQAHV